MNYIRAGAQADLRWAHMSVCWFCHAAAHLRIEIRILFDENSKFLFQYLYSILSNLYQLLSYTKILLIFEELGFFIFKQPIG